ncbi:hypothetical protein [Oceanisphaera sp.]|uniref:hypothetical protein n=1 Tax=Oceanisphaera sp. TaxID=1929979 RepID=UPI003A95C410
MHSAVRLHKKKASTKGVVSVSILALLLISLIDPFVDGMRYAKYGIPIICIFVFLADKGRIVTDESTRPFLFLSVVTLLMSPLGNINGVHDFYFYLTALSPFLLGCAPNISPKFFFNILVVFFVGMSIPEVLDHGFEYSILDSTSTLENDSFSFVFGLFSVFFFLIKEKKYFVFSLVMAVLVLKRISIIAILVIFIIYYIFPIWILKKARLAGLLINFLFLLVAYYITTEAFHDLSIELFNVNSAYLTMGRTVLYEPVFSSTISLVDFLFGHGAGESYTIAAASIFVDDGKVNIHSDILKIYYELGFIAFALFFVLAYKPRDKSIFLFMYVNIIFFTDNISTYFIVMYVYFYLSEVLRKNKYFHVTGKVANKF